MLHSQYVRKRAPAQLEWRWLNSFRLPLLSRRRRCRPFLRVVSLREFYEGMQVFVLMFSVRQPELDSRASCIVQACRFPRRFEFELPTYTHRQTHIVLQECSLFMFRFNCADVQERFYFFVPPQATQVFGWLLVQVKILRKWLILLTQCVCVLGTALSICRRTIARSCSTEPTKGAFHIRKKKTETEKKLNETAPRPSRFVSEVSCPHMCVNQWLADLRLHNFQLSWLLLPRPQIVFLGEVHTWWWVKR